MSTDSRNVNYQEAKQLFAERLRSIRKQKQLTQEQLAEHIAKSTEHVSFLERGERSPSFELIVDLANALGVSISYLMSFDSDAPHDAFIEELEVAPVDVRQVDVASETSYQQRKSDLERLETAIGGIRQMQVLANEYGIRDILQDNGGKVLQVLILLGLRVSPGREGNDAIDLAGNEYELKTINLALNKNAGITTHHHLNHDIIEKYRQVKAWYIAFYDGIELIEIYRIEPSILEPLFQQWEQKVQLTGKELNNPKIPQRYIRSGERVYPRDKSSHS